MSLPKMGHFYCALALQETRRVLDNQAPNVATASRVLGKKTSFGFIR